MNQEQSQQAFRVLNILVNYKKLIIGCLLAGILAGLGMYLKTPKRYQASALIMYQQQSINPTNMSPDIQARFEEIVNTVSQQVTSRRSLEGLIKQYDLYNTGRENIPIEDIIINMRENHIDITTEPRSNIFKVSYHGGSPKKVLLVTNAIAGKFIEENIRFREERTTETLEYIKEELRMAKIGLDEKEKVMRDYKLKYYNEMPEQRQANISRINAIQEQYQSLESNAQSLEQTKALVLEQISLRKEMLIQAQRLDNQATTSEGLLGTSSALTSDDQENIAEIRRSLETLRTKYTDQHPDVKRLKSHLEQLENNQVTPESGEQAPETVQMLNDPQVAQLEMQLKEITYNIKRLKTERKELRIQIEQFTKWAQAAPIREAEWSALTRDYDQLKQHYEMLVAKSLDAESAKTLEQRQQGSQFKIVDPARLPEKPFKPDFMRIMLIAAALGLGVGFGVSYILEAQDTSFKVATDIESYLNLPVICSIPLIQSASDKKKNRIKTVTWATVLIVSVVAIAAEIIYLWQQGTIII